MTRRLVILAVVLLVAATGCNEAAQAAWARMTPGERTAYLTATGHRSGDCYEAIDRHWPAPSRQWARRIVARESGGDPRAQNPSSSAAGCFQLLAMHGHRIPGGWGARYDADANTLGALHLYREAGVSPWT